MQWIFWAHLAPLECGNYNLEIPKIATKIRQNVGYSFSGRSAHEPSDIPSIQLEFLNAKYYV